jgi:hypothetical protein
MHLLEASRPLSMPWLPRTRTAAPGVTRILTTSALALVVGGAVANPTLAQDDAYAAALQSGDLSVLIPEPFADAEIAGGMPFDVMLLMPVNDEQTADRDALQAILTQAGVAPSDVASLTAFVVRDNEVMSFGATRIPGVQAVAWFEPYYGLTMANSFREPTRELIPVGDKQVLRIADRQSERTELAHPQGEVLWVLTGDGALRTSFLEGLQTIAGPPLSVDPGAPAGGEPVAVIGTPDDPLSQIPAEINGAASEVQTFPVAAVLDGVDANNPDAVSMADGLRALLDSVGGADRATIISGMARGADGDGVQILGLNVDGGDQASFRDGFIQIFLLPELEEPVFEESQLGGKAVTRLSDTSRLAGTQAWIYGVGETVWVLRGQDEYIAALLRTMP